MKYNHTQKVHLHEKRVHKGILELSYLGLAGPLGGPPREQPVEHGLAALPQHLGMSCITCECVRYLTLLSSTYVACLYTA